MRKYKIFTKFKSICSIVTISAVLINTTSLSAITYNIELNEDFYEYTQSVSENINGENQIGDELEYTEEYLEYLKLPEEEKKNHAIIPSMYKVPINQNDIASKNYEIESFSSEEKNIASSAYYKMANLRTENQGKSGWCWAYACLKCLETYLMKHDNIGKNENYNFAEYHLAYMKYKNFNASSGWKNAGESANSDIYLKGGNFDDFMKYAGILSKEIDAKSIEKNYEIIGPITGKDDENHIYETIECEQFQNKIPEYKITKTIQFGCIKKDYDENGKRIGYKDYEGNSISQSTIDIIRQAVKEHIVDNGAVFAYSNIADSNFNKEKSAIYIHDNSLKINHAVAIVGWDDNYSKENFKTQPACDGAWIALNSWGEENKDTDNGYIYISYDDAIAERYLYGILEAQKYENDLNCVVSYSTKESTSNSVVVTITSNEKLVAPDSSWEAGYVDKEVKDYYTIYETKSLLTKTYDNNTKEEVELKSVSGSSFIADIEIKNIETKSNSKEGVFGDINLDDKVNIIDLLVLKRHLIAGDRNEWKIADDKLEIADLNRDGRVNIVDLLVLKRVISSL